MKRFLLPTDFSEPADQAARYALELATVVGAQVLLVHVKHQPMIDSDLPTFPWPEPSGRRTQAVLSPVETQTREELEQYAEGLRLRVGGKVKVQTLLLRGIPEEEIPALALREHCDLIVMGTRGHSKLYKTFFGSVTAGVVEQARVPVLVIPEAAVFRGVRHVMYACDFDPADGPTIRSVIHLLSPLDFDLCSVYVFNDGGRPYEREDYDGLREALAHHLRGVAMEGTIHVDATGSQDLLEGLEEAVRDNRVDILVMTTHRRSFMTRLTHPSLTKRMIAHTHTPLLIFKAQDKPQLHL